MTIESHPVRAVLFDLDGTLVDPFEGITSSYQHALARLDRPVPPASDLAPCIGPPLRRNFERLLGTGDRALVERAVTHYRERYGEIGWRQNVVYEGIDAVLGRLRARGLPMYVTTAKPEPYASRIVEHHGLCAFVLGVFGPDLDGHLDDKARLVACALGRTGVDPETTILVGDREYDMRAARENGLRGVGVTWGYGSAQELAWAGACELCRTPAELEALVLSAPAPTG